MNSLLEVKQLKKSYNKTTALKGIDFSVREGTCFGLLGPNGAGKSTTMKILTGIIQADEGSVSILGLDVKRHQEEIRRQVGYVPQNITLYEKLTVRDNLVFFGELYGIRGSSLNKRMEELLLQVGLQHREKDVVGNLSGGMKRRINMAAAMLHQPKLLILDEPTVGVDPQSRNHIFEMIRALIAGGTTVIYSTHYMEEVEALCDDVAIIDQGQVITDGSLHEVLKQHGSRSIFVEAEGFERLLPLPIEASVQQKDTGWKIETDQVMEVMRYILQQAADLGMEIQSLEILRPSLESVFLSLTGTSLRD